MAKIEVVLDAAKLRGLVYEREYTNKNNEVVKVQEVKFELVEVKDPKTIVSGTWGEKKKTHFAAAIQTKEEKAAKTETNYIGDGFTTYFAGSKQQNEPVAAKKEKPQSDISTPEPTDIPF